MARKRRPQPGPGWRRLPGDAPDPRPVADSLDALARRLGVPDSRALASVFNEWKTIAGDTLATHSRPISLNNRVLTVAVDGGAWATQLNFLAGQLLDRVADAAGERIADRVHVVVRPLGTGPKDTG